MVRASIDIGSNSLLCLIGDVEDGKIEEIKTIIRITALGKDLDAEGKFCDQSIKDSFAALKEFKKEIETFGLDPLETIVTATEASRVATNSAEFFAKVRKELGFSVKIINSQGEAYYTALGVSLDKFLSDKNKEEFVLMDIGGASTELIHSRHHPFKVKKSISLPIGSVRAADWIEESHFQEKINALVSADEIHEFECETLVCVAGTMTALGCMINGEDSLAKDNTQGVVISFDKFCSFVDQISDLEPEVLLKQYPFLEKRAWTISAGARVARAFCLNLKVKNLVISGLGLRYGTLFQGEVDEQFIEG